MCKDSGNASTISTVRQADGDEVRLILLTVGGMVEESVGVVEDVPLANGVVVVVSAEGVSSLFQLIICSIE